MTTEEQIARLPKWAQDRIRILERNNKSLQKQVAQIEGREATNTSIAEGIDQRPLPNNAVIRFQFGETRHITCRVSDGMLYLNGTGRLAIWPVASNDVVIAVNSI